MLWLFFFVSVGKYSRGYFLFYISITSYFFKIWLNFQFTFFFLFFFLFFFCFFGLGGKVFPEDYFFSWVCSCITCITSLLLKKRSFYQFIKATKTNPWTCMKDFLIFIFFLRITLTLQCFKCRKLVFSDMLIQSVFINLLSMSLNMYQFKIST